MVNSSTAAVLLAAALAAGCADSPVAPSRVASPGAATLTQDPDILSGNGRQLFHTRQWHDANGKGVGTNNTGIYYHGGPVLLTGTNAVAIYWSSSTIYDGGPRPGTSGGRCVDNSLVGHFMANYAPSPYFNINSTYTDGAGHPIANKVSYTGCWANNTNVPFGAQTVSDFDMQSMIVGGFTSGTLTYDPNTLYIVFTAGPINLGGGFGTQYCAYHFFFDATINGVSRVVKYAAMPYAFAYPAACSMFAGTGAVLPPNGDYGADAEVNLLAHETEETTTDPETTAWFDHKGNENADKCAWTFGTTYTTGSGGTANVDLGGKNFLIQQNWVNVGGGGCAMHFP